MWKNIFLDSGISMNSIYIYNSSNAIAVGDDGKSLATTDTGITWNSIDSYRNKTRSWCGKHFLTSIFFEFLQKTVYLSFYGKQSIRYSTEDSLLSIQLTIVWKIVYSSFYGNRSTRHHM